MFLSAALALVFAVLVGRNDGAPLVALAIRSLHQQAWWPPIILIAAIVSLPALGINAVAATLAALLRDDSAFGLSVLLLATTGTLLVSTRAGIPTSITLGLVGASAGAQLAGGSLDFGPIVRVLVLAACGPVVAWLLALVVTPVVTLSRGRRLDRTVRRQQLAGFVVTAVAYGANDGQKLLAVFSVMLGLGVGAGALDLRLIGLVSVCFLLGVGLGLRRSVLSLRQGVLHPKPYQVASTLFSSATAVLLGSVAAAPMSMTQSITGALIGSAPPREWRRIRWAQSRRILLAWVWTLPIAGAIAWVLTLLTAALDLA